MAGLGTWLGWFGQGRVRQVLAGAVLAAVLHASAAPAQTAGQQADPPARVGRVARLTGTVSQHGAGADRWEPATANFPVSTGSGLWTEPGGGADVEVGGDRWVLDAATQLEWDRLDDAGIGATLLRGEVYVRLRDDPAGPVLLRTPRGTVELRAAGRYGIAAGDAEHPTTVSVIEGSARIEAPGVDQTAATGQAVLVTGSEGSLQASVVPVQPDAFLAAQIARERAAAQPARPVAALPPPVRRMTGYAALEDTGRWDSLPEYGQVWYPDVGPDWVPYREGRWAWVAPWGWTWVDDAPWGFATSHYGRWVHANDRWCWTPVVPGAAVEAVPVFAPALVAFTAAAIRSRGRERPPVGWVPLGPREPYFPPYRASPGYVHRINVHNVTNVAVLQRPDPRAFYRQPFVNRGAATFVPAGVLAGSQPVARAVQPLPPAALVRPVFGAVPVRPGPSTAGLTHAAARQMRLPPPAFPPAPGPALAGQRVAPPAFGPQARPFFRADGSIGRAGFAQPGAAGREVSGLPPGGAPPGGIAAGAVPGGPPGTGAAIPPGLGPSGPPSDPRRPNLLASPPAPLPATLPQERRVPDRAAPAPGPAIGPGGPGGRQRPNLLMDGPRPLPAALPQERHGPERAVPQPWPGPFSPPGGYPGGYSGHRPGGPAPHHERREFRPSFQPPPGAGLGSPPGMPPPSAQPRPAPQPHFQPPPVQRPMPAAVAAPPAPRPAPPPQAAAPPPRPQPPPPQAHPPPSQPPPGHQRREHHR